MKMIPKISALVALLLGAFSATAVAEGGAAPSQDELNPWTRCGIGAMIFPTTPVGAVISNVIWDLGTTAVTSAASSKNTCEGKDVQAALFIQETYANLEEATARGEGAHLTAMLDIFGCETGSHQGIISAVRSDFAEVVSQPGYAEQAAQEKAATYYSLVKTQVTGAYAQQCNI